jgi:NAD(P)-dependent dehydrogenase (short-subunit alcohol dehydrogenase family)
VQSFFSNAAVPGSTGPILETSVEDWDTTFAVVLRSAFLGIKHAGQALVEQGEGGAIISTSSVAGLVGGGGPDAYSAAKAGVVNLTRNAAVELAPHRIRVNATCPGSVYTPLVHRGAFDPDSAKNPAQPWPDYGKPEYQASAVLFLASDDAVFVTGEALVVDGGLIAAGLRIYENHLRPTGYDAGTTGFTAPS